MTKLIKHLFGLLNGTNRERGSTFAWVTVLSVVSIGMASLVVDVGLIQRERARMQKAVDAAALAGAIQLPYETHALLKARDLAMLNGYTHGSEGCQVTGQRNPDGMHSGWYQVRLSQPIDYYLAPIMGYNSGVITVTATASYISPLPLYIAGSAGEYGINGIMNLSCFGPYAPFTYGDAYSVRWLNNGDDNPYYNDNGYNFTVDVKDDYFARNGTNEICIQVFDPDTWNAGGAVNAGPNAVDEIRSAPGPPHPQPSSQFTLTRFQLYEPDSTPADFTDDVLIAEASWQEGDFWSDMKWVTPEGWAFNLAVHGYGKYRINVKTLDGSSENGFNLRAGPPAACEGDEDDWYANNGTEITAMGTLPINFNQTGTVNVDLGYIPPEAAGFDVYINNFDTDVGSKYITFYDDFGNSWPGTLSSDGTFSLDVITIPENHPGGRLYAEYAAGSQDTSSWQLYFDGKLEDSPGEVRLVD